jgi:dolichyl-phosphate-mannose-protein mannosyltransferase
MEPNPDTASTNMMIADGDHRGHHRVVLGSAIAVGVLVLVALRAHAFALPLETDECNYLYIASQLATGGRLYVDVWDHQPPGVFAMYAVIVKAFGATDSVMRWTAIAFSIATLGTIAAVGYRRRSLVAATFGVVLFAVVSSDPATASEGCNREIYMNTLSVLAILLLTTRQRSARTILLAGLCFGLSSLFKTVSAAQWLAVATWLVLSHPDTSHCDARDSMTTRIRRLLWFGVGPLFCWLTTLAYFAWTGRFSTFIDAVFKYNIGYSRLDGGSATRILGFFNPMFDVFTSAWPLWTIAPIAFGIVLIRSRATLSSTTGLILAYALGSFVAVCLPGRYWPHYYGLLIPPMVLLFVELVGHANHARVGHRRCDDLPADRRRVSVRTLLCHIAR